MTQTFTLLVLSFKKMSWICACSVRKTPYFSGYLFICFCFFASHCTLFGETLERLFVNNPPTIQIGGQNTTSPEGQKTLVLLPKINIPSDSIDFYETLLNHIGQRIPLTAPMLAAIGEAAQTAATTHGNIASHSKPNAPLVSPPTSTESAAGMSEVGREISYKRVLQTITDKQNELRSRYAGLKGNNKDQVLHELAVFVNNTVAEDMQTYWLGRALKPVCEKTDLTPVENTRNLVASMLHDLGFVTDYTKMITLAPRELVALLSEKNTPKYCKNVAELNDYLSKKGNGIYVASFDKYVGIINYNGINTYLYMASPGNGGKISEIILNDTAKQDFMFPFFNVASISYNSELLKKWLNNKPL